MTDDEAQKLAGRMGAMYKGKVEAGHGYFGAMQAAANMRGKAMTSFEKFIDVERAEYGHAEYWYKTEKLKSKIKAFYARPFCPEYLTNVTTTNGRDTALPESRRDDHYNALWTEFHENVHKFDIHQKPIRFYLGYAYPQILAVPFLLAATILAGLWGWLGLGALLLTVHAGLSVLHGASGAGKRVAGKAWLVLFGVLAVAGVAAFLGGVIVGGSYWAFLLLGAGLFLSPWPFKAVFRRDSELRGYTMSIYGYWLDRGSCEVSEAMIDIFRGPTYFFMEPNGEFVRKELTFQVARFLSDESLFLSEWRWARKPDKVFPKPAVPFRMARQFLEAEGLIGA
jgi:hypothetical protein